MQGLGLLKGHVAHLPVATKLDKLSSGVHAVGEKSADLRFYAILEAFINYNQITGT